MIYRIINGIFPAFLLILGLNACIQKPVESGTIDKVLLENSQSQDSCMELIREKLLSNLNFAIADSLEKTRRDNNSAVEYYSKALVESRHSLEKYFIGYKIGYCLFQDYKDKAAIDVLKSLLNNSALTDSLDCVALKAETYSLLGLSYSYISRYPADRIEFPAYFYADSAIVYMNQALDFYKSYLQKNDIKLANIYQDIGEVYRLIQQNYLRAEEYYTKAQEIATASAGINTIAQLRNLYGLAVVNRDKGDYGKAEIYGNRLLEMADSADLKHYKSLAFSCLGNVSLNTKNYKSAKSYINSAIAINLQINGSKSNLFVYYNNLTQVLIALGELEKAREICDRAIEMTSKNPSLINELPTSYLHKGEVLEKLGKRLKALNSYHTSLSMRIDNYGIRHRRVAMVHDRIGVFYQSIGEIDSALFYIQNALVAGSEGFSHMDYRKNPDLQNISGNRGLIKVLENKSDVLLARFNMGNANHGDLELAFSCLQLCDLLIDQSWNSFLGEESKLFLESGVHPIYEKAIGIAYEDYKLSGKLEKVADVFHFFEKNRYRYLLDNLSNEYAFEEAKVSDSLVGAMKDVEYGLNYFKLELKEGVHEKGIIENEIYQLTDKKESLILQLQEEYPDFFRLKYETKRVIWDEVKDFLSNKQTGLVEFFYGEEHIFVLSTDGQEISFVSVKRDADLNKALETIIQTCSNPDPKLLMDSFAFQDYLNSSALVYKLLLKETLEQNLGKHIKSLVIIPDGNLSRISFESLITSPANETFINSDRPEYLIHNYSVSYGFSSKILLAGREPDRVKKNKILGFSYGSLEQPGSSYSPLSGSSKELKAISRLFKGQYFENAQATESNFKKYASDYYVLHLALHGEADVENDDSTMLVFRPNEEELDDGFLLPFELYNLDLHARMVVLSSCQSGLGKAYEGEGIYSMARAFAYKGIPTLVSTLWPVHDEASATIMRDFYRLLDEDKSIDTALREAKLQYLEKAGSYLAHPAIWSSYVPVGKMDNVKIKRNQSIWIGLLTIATLVLLLIIAYKFIYLAPNNQRTSNSQNYK